MGWGGRGALFNTADHWPTWKGKANKQPATNWGVQQRYRPLTHISVATATILQNEVMKLSNENLAAFFMGLQCILLKIDSLSLQIWVWDFSDVIVHCFRELLIPECIFPTAKKGFLNLPFF